LNNGKGKNHLTAKNLGKNNLIAKLKKASNFPEYPHEQQGQEQDK